MRFASDFPEPQEKIPIIFDTDIGSDIDDAVCLAYLLRQPRCELLGVTTVSDMPRHRAALVDALCRAEGRTDIPVHSGTDVGINLGIVQPGCPQADILPRFEHQKPDDFEPYTAIEFLRQQIHRRPGEITLLAVGPMTNIALLFTVDPEIPRKLKRLVLMCGWFSGKKPDWNAHCDPIAAAMVYRAAVRDHLSVTMDVTLQCQIPSREAIVKFGEIGGGLSVVSAAAEIWAAQREELTFHDPLTAAVLFKPEICEYRNVSVGVSLELDEKGKRSGKTFFKNEEPKLQRVTVGVNPTMFFQHYFEVVSGKPLETVLT